MKRFFSLLLTALLLFGCPVCAFAEEADFAGSIEGQAMAVALAYHEGSYPPDVTPADPAFLWEATAWYAAWLCHTKGIELLDEGMVRDFQRSLGNREAPAVPAFIEGAISVMRATDGKLYYSFGYYQNTLEELLSRTLTAELDAPEAPEAVVSLRQYYSANASALTRYTLHFMRNRDAGSAFAWSLRDVEAPALGPAMDPELDFDWEGLVAANSLTNLLSIFPVIKMTNDYYGESYTWLFLRDGDICLITESGGYVYGEYRGCSFSYEECEDGRMRARVSSFDAPSGEMAAWDSFIVNLLGDVAVVDLESLDREQHIVHTRMTYPGDWEQEVAIEHAVLAVLELRSHIEGAEEDFVTRFDYREKLPDFPFLESWDGPMRTVTLHWEDWYSGARSTRTETVTLPADWELLPWEGQWGDYTIYMNEGYTQSYAYPGDGTDYTLWLTTAKG